MGNTFRWGYYQRILEDPWVSHTILENSEIGIGIRSHSIKDLEKWVLAEDTHFPKYRGQVYESRQITRGVWCRCSFCGVKVSQTSTIVQSWKGCVCWVLCRFLSLWWWQATILDCEDINKCRCRTAEASTMHTNPILEALGFLWSHSGDLWWLGWKQIHAMED